TLEAPEHTTLSLALSQLVIGKDNPRANSEEDEDITALATSIAAIGLIQPLIVIKRSGKYSILDGRRRFLAMKHLEAEGTISSDFSVPAMQVSQKHKAAGLVANIQRRNMTPVETFAAVSALSKSMKSPDKIARVLGLEVRTVRQHQALGGLPVDFLSALEAGHVRFDMAKALCRVDDLERRRQFIDQALAGELQFWQLRNILKSEKHRSDEHIAQFVTEAAYVAAGGKVEGDLFDDYAFWVSPEALETAFQTALKPLAEKLQSFGLAETHISISSAVPDNTVDLEDYVEFDDEAKATQFEADWNAYQAAFYQAWRHHIDTGTEESRSAVTLSLCDLYGFALETVPAETRAELRPYILFGSVPIVVFVLSPIEDVEEDEDNIDPISVNTGEDTKPDDVAQKVDEIGRRHLNPSGALKQRLHEIRTRVFAKDLISRPDVALALLIAQLSGQFRTRLKGASPLKIWATPFTVGIGNDIVNEDESWSATRTSVETLLTPREGLDLIDHILGLSDQERMSVLAFLVADCVDLTEPRNPHMGKPDIDVSTSIAAKIDADPAKHWTPDTVTLTGFTKGALVDIAAILETELDSGLKKMNLVSDVEKLTAEKTWVHPFVKLSCGD
ncbi:MAG: ParB/RepB/Spo0J family partition protein, partial [Pseudomonadota bacterium]